MRRKKVKNSEKIIEAQHERQHHLAYRHWVRYFYYTFLAFFLIAFSMTLGILIARFIRPEKTEIKFDRETIENLVNFDDMPANMDPALRISTHKSIVDEIMKLNTPEHPDTYIVLKSALTSKLKIKMMPRINPIYPFDDVANSGMFWLFSNTLGLKVYEIEPKELVALPGYPDINNMFHKLIEHEFHHAAVAMTNSGVRCDPSAITNLEAILAGSMRTPSLPHQSEKIAKIYDESSRLILNKLQGLLKKRDQNKLDDEGIQLLNNLSQSLKDYQPYLILYSIKKQDHAVKAKEVLNKGEVYILRLPGRPVYYVHAYYDFGDQVLLLGHFSKNTDDKLNQLIQDINYFVNYVGKTHGNPPDVRQLEVDAYASYNTDKVVRTMFFHDVHKTHLENMKHSKCAIAREAAQLVENNENNEKDINDIELANYYSKLKKYS